MLFRTLLVLFSCLFSLLFVSSSYADNPQMLARRVPPPRCAVVPPPGCRNCFLIAPTYGCGVWQDQHYECYYADTPDVWIGAHWQCNRYYPTTGVCGSWRWVSSYWLRRPVCVSRPVVAPPPPPPVVYGPPPPVVYGPPPPVVYGPPPPVVVAPPPAFFFGIGGGGYRGHCHRRCW